MPQQRAESESGTHRQRRPTQREVARLAGVSQATVSIVLTGQDSGVSLETRRRVQEALKTVGYQPNLLARGLRGVPTALLGVIARGVAHPLIGGMIDAVTRAARGHGYNVITADAGDSAGDALILANLMKDRLCDAVVLLGDLPDDQVLWAGYQELGLTAVGLMQGSRELPIPNVSVDNAGGTQLALDHLRALGHKRIAILYPSELHAALDRLARYEDLCHHHRLIRPPEYVVGVANVATDGALAMEKLLQLETPPTAVFAANDELALGALCWAAENGVSVPDDVCVIGFDDSPHAQVAVPRLTTVAQPMEEMAAIATKILLGKTRPSKMVHLVRPALIVRASTGRPRDP